MRCAKCPLFESWNTENDRGENCGLFGEDWGNRYQYEDAQGSICGCYIDKHLIEKIDRAHMNELESRVIWYTEQEERGVSG